MALRERMKKKKQVDERKDSWDTFEGMNETGEEVTMRELGEIPPARKINIQDSRGSSGSPEIVANDKLILEINKGVQKSSIDDQLASFPIPVLKKESGGRKFLSIVEASKQVDDSSNLFNEREIDERSPIEKDILRVAKHNLKKKRYTVKIDLDPPSEIIEKLIGDCLAKYQFQKNYTKELIINTIRTLEKKRWIVSGERRTKE
ncbi:MAG: hypothetical protein ACTSYS_00005, partial [Promethearchaeota archaeon]